MKNLRSKVTKLLVDIREHCRKCGRNFEDVKVLAATKYANTVEINAIIEAGIDLIGENRVQDAKKKFNDLATCRRHFIGHLQTNKVRDAVKLFDCIESVDSLRLAQRIDKEAQKVMPIYIQVNVADDPQKYGVKMSDLKTFISKIRVLNNIEIKGLMAIVPHFEDATKVRPYFRKMKKICDDESLEVLSMGMSNDYKIAIEEGATELRIGSLLFK